MCHSAQNHPVVPTADQRPVFYPEPPMLSSSVRMYMSLCVPRNIPRSLCPGTRHCLPSLILSLLPLFPLPQSSLPSFIKRTNHHGAPTRKQVM